MSISKKIKVLFAILSAGIISVTAMPASAYVLLDAHIANKTASYKWGDKCIESSVYKSAWELAIDDWDASNDATYYLSAVSANELNLYDEASTSEFGYTRRISVNYDILETFELALNRGNSEIRKPNVARSTAVHELGHTLGLADRSSGTAIMNTNRDRSSIYLPQTDDINGVNAVYR